MTNRKAAPVGFLTSRFSKLLMDSGVRYTSMYPAPRRFCTWSSSRAATVCRHIVHQRIASVHGPADGRQTRVASSGRKPGGLERLHGVLSGFTPARLSLCRPTHAAERRQETMDHPHRCDGI